MPTDKFQLTEEHNQAQNILEIYSSLSHSSYTKEFDVRTYIFDSVEYNMCSLNSFEFSNRFANVYTKYKTLQCKHLQQTNKNETKIQQNNDTT